MKKPLKKCLFLIATLIGHVAFSQSKNTLWHKEPARYFQQSLIMGNRQKNVARKTYDEI